MAHILDDHEGSFSHHAPLSHAQSVAIARHLQDQVQQLGGAVKEVSVAQQEGSAKTRDLATQLNGTQRDLQALHQNFVGAKGDAETTKRALQRTQSSLQQMQADFSKACEDIRAMRDSQQLADATAQKMGQALAEANAATSRLEAALKRCQDNGISQLRNELAQQELDIQSLKNGHIQQQESIQDHRESMRMMESRVNGLGDRCGELEVQLQMEKHRLEETMANVKGTQEGLNAVTEFASALRDDHEKAKDQLLETRNTVKKIGGKTKSLQDSLQGTVKDLEATSGRLDEAIRKLEAVDVGLTEVRDAVRTNTQGGESTRQALSRLTGEVGELRAATSQVRAGLKETTSLLLPNIHQDSAEVRSATARHGSLLVTGGGSLLGPSGGLSAGSPRHSPAQPAGTPAANRSTPLDMTRRPSDY